MNAKFFVPYQTAKLLKEKGYPQAEEDWYWYWYYGGKRQMLIDNATTDLLRQTMGFNGVEIIAAPTYHEVLDWLYEKKICITCHPAYSYEGQYNGFQYEMQTYDEDDYPDDIYRTREETLNSAIISALEML